MHYNLPRLAHKFNFEIIKRCFFFMALTLIIMIATSSLLSCNSQADDAILDDRCYLIIPKMIVFYVFTVTGLITGFDIVKTRNEILICKPNFHGFVKCRFVGCEIIYISAFASFNTACTLRIHSYVIWMRITFVVITHAIIVITHAIIIIFRRVNL